MTVTSRPREEALADREQRHRRRILLGLAALLVLSMSPVFGHHLPLGYEQTLAGRDHFWALCMAALHVLLAPIHGLFHLLFAAGVGYATLDRVRAWRRQRSVLLLLPTTPPLPDSELWAAAARVGLEPDRIVVVPGLPSPAFTIGWIRPVVYVDARLAACLSRDELEAVLAHEAAHVRRRDPLRFSTLRFLACTLFWLTAVRRLVEDLADEAEVMADDAAVRGRPLALASALLTLAQWRAPMPTGVGFGDRDMLDRRIRRLAGQSVGPQTRLTRRAVATTFLALMLAWSAGVVAAHPAGAEGDEHSQHCQHEGFAALMHLYCPGYGAHASRDACPHRSW
jgi:Zn-dependent protease with chaperone function